MTKYNSTLFSQLKSFFNFIREMPMARKLSPKYLILFVTSACNARCGHCFYYTQNKNTNSEDLSLDTIEEIATSLDKLQVLTLTGGEPFLRNDLSDISTIFYRNTKIDTIHIPTNGLLPLKTRDITEKILSTCKCNITLAISLDAIGEEHDTLRGIKGAFDNVTKTYGLLKDLKNKYPNFTLAVNTVISNKNYDGLSNIVEFVKYNFEEVDVHDFDWLRGIPKDSAFCLPSLQQLKEIKGLLIKTARHYYLKKKSPIALRVSLALNELLFNLRYGIIKEKRQLINCRAGDLFAVINANGDISLCELLENIGNIKRKKFLDIWNSREADLQRKMIKDKKCFCTHGCFQPVNLRYDFRTYLKVPFIALTNG